MLVLSRKKHERICIGNNVVVTVVALRHDKVRIGIEAPHDVPIHRDEVFAAIKRGGGEIPDLVPQRALAEIVTGNAGDPCV